MNFFKKGEDGMKDTSCTSSLSKIEHLLRLHGLETWELIHQFNLERLQEQEEMQNADLGMLTVRVQFVENLLRVDIMNARNLKPKDSNGETCSIVYAF